MRVELCFYMKVNLPGVEVRGLLTAPGWQGPEAADCLHSELCSAQHRDAVGLQSCPQMPLLCMRLHVLEIKWGEGQLL